MNIFNKVALQGLRKNRTRTLVTIIGVALSAALITAVAVFSVSLQTYLIHGAAAKYGNWHIEIPDADSAFVQKQAKDSRVADIVMLQNIGYTPLEGCQNPDKPYLFVSGWNEAALETLPIKLLSGRLPENSSEVVIPAHIASNGGVKISVGDTLTLPLGSRMSGGQKLSQHNSYRSGEEMLVTAAEKTYMVVGICWRPAIEEYTAPGYTLITTPDPAVEDSLTVFITLKNPYQVHSYAGSISDSYSSILNDDVLRFMGLSGEKILTVLLYSIGFILIALVMLGSIFLIYNAFNISLNERIRQFGILMSIGATEKQLRNSVLFEGLCIAMVGIPLGILAGIPGIGLVLSLAAKNFANVMYDSVPLTLVVSFPLLAAAAAISLITILISAYIPAKKAVSTPVMECIRQNGEVRLEADMVKSPKFMRRLFGLAEMLALKNFKRTRRRCRSIILSLTLSVVLFVSAGSFGTYLNQIADQSSVVSEAYDICFYTQDMDESELFQLYDGLKNVGGITESSYQALLAYSCELNTDDLPDRFLEEYSGMIDYDEINKTASVPLNIQFVERRVYQNLLERNGLSAEEYTGQDNKMVMAGILPGGWYTQEQPMEFTIRSQSEGQEKTIRAAWIKDYPDLLPSEAGEMSGFTLMVIAPYEVKPQFDALHAAVKPAKLGMTFQSENPGRSASEMQSVIEGAGIAADYHLYNVHQIMEQNRNITFIINLFSFVFITMITLIAVANVFNTISTNIRLRRRELAMLRSLGMSDRDFNRMMRFECVLYGVRTMVWGLPVSGFLSCLIYKGMVTGGGELDFVFPWSSMAVSVIGVFFIVFITMVYVTGKIRKENVIDALRDDMA